jgi:hypothetical protein
MRMRVAAVVLWLVFGVPVGSISRMVLPDGFVDRRNEVMSMSSTAEQLFKGAANFLTLIDAIIPIATEHTYTFVSDEWYQEWLWRRTPRGRAKSGR